MYRLVHIIASLVIAIGLGAFSARTVIAAWPSIGATRSGAWAMVPGLGTDAAAPHAKAYQHLAARMVLGPSEGVVYVAETDDAGKPLTPLCHYALVGEVPLAALFTLHAVDAQGRMIEAASPRPDLLHSDGLIYSADRYRIDVSASARPGNWLAVDTFAPYRLVFTQYDAAVVTDETVRQARLPSIISTGCGNA